MIQRVRCLNFYFHLMFNLVPWFGWVSPFCHHSPYISALNSLDQGPMKGDRCYSLWYSTYMVHKTWPRHVSFSSGILWKCHLSGVQPHSPLHSNLSLGEGVGVVLLDWIKQKNLCQYQFTLYTKIKHTICTYSFINATILSAVLSFTSKANSPSLIIKKFTHFMSIFPKPNKAVNSTSLNPNTNVKPFTYLKYFTENRWEKESR